MSFEDLIEIKTVNYDESEKSIDWSIKDVSRTEIDIQIKYPSNNFIELRILIVDISKLSQFHGGLPESNVILLDLRK